MITENKLYLDPSKVYIPLTDNVSKIASVKVEIGDKVLQGTLLANKFNGKNKTAVLSSVSGEVIGFEEKLDRFGKIVDHCVIENDKVYARIDLKSLPQDPTSAQIRNRLAEAGVNQITVDGNYTDIDFKLPINHVLVNIISENEPFITTDYMTLKQYAEEVADGIQLLAKAAHTENITILVDKKMDPEALESIGKAVVDKGINVIQVDATKVDGWDHKIALSLAKEDLSNNLLENGILYTNSAAALMVYEAVRENKTVSKRNVTVTGDGFISNVNYEVRLGTLFSELAEDLGGYTQLDNLNLHIGSFLSGIQLENDDFAITASVSAINVEGLDEETEDVCIKCGDCNDVCPAGILPQNIMDAELRSVKERIIDLNTHLCVECGLCTYVCPSKINVLEWVRRAKRRVG